MGMQEQAQFGLCETSPIHVEGGKPEKNGDGGQRNPVTVKGS